MRGGDKQICTRIDSERRNPPHLSTPIDTAPPGDRTQGLRILIPTREPLDLRPRYHAPKQLIRLRRLPDKGPCLLWQLRGSPWNEYAHHYKKIYKLKTLELSVSEQSLPLVSCSPAIDCLWIRLPHAWVNEERNKPATSSLRFWHSHSFLYVQLHHWGENRKQRWLLSFKKTYAENSHIVWSSRY